MQRLFYTLFLASMLISCMSPQGFYNVELQEVERPENAIERYGESKIVNFQEEGKTKYSYEDEMIKIVWTPLPTEFAFTLQNKTDHSIKIIWDEAVYVNENGSGVRVMHSGVKYTDRSNSQPSTVVVKNANIDDTVVPTDKVSYNYAKGWISQPLFPNRATTSKELNTLSQSYIGKTVQVLLPLQIEDTVNEYIFNFKVEGFVAK